MGIFSRFRRAGLVTLYRRSLVTPSGFIFGRKLELHFAAMAINKNGSLAACVTQFRDLG